MRRGVTIFALLLAATAQIAIARERGQFIGVVIAQWLEGGRKMELKEPFAYVDPKGERWDAPTGSIVDGASIPRVAWTLIGGPYEGPYRNASVIHDIACDRKVRTWQEVHRVFYEAMLDSGVPLLKAKIMYAAVYHGGPRWRESIRTVRLADDHPILTSSDGSKFLREARPNENMQVRTRTVYVCETGADKERELGEFRPPTTSCLQDTPVLEQYAIFTSEQQFDQEQLLRIEKEVEASNLSLEEIEAMSFD